MSPRKSKNTPIVLTREQQIAKLVAEVSKNDIVAATIAKPTRTYAIGQQVQCGGLKNAVILQSLFDDKLYIMEHDGGLHDAWWFGIEDNFPNDRNTPSLFAPYRRGRVMTADLDSILYLYGGDGLVCDPTYQRGYVWTAFDQEQLLTSIFERLEIGGFILVRKHGYLHKNTTPVRYITLAGDTVLIPQNEDNSVTVVDGQQRLTTLVNFYLDRISYKGIRYSEMSFHDRHNFTGFSIQYRIIEEDEITRAETLKMFLQSNRGVPQNAEHLTKVAALYAEEIAKA